MMITVFTPTYNRGVLLRRLYESLVGQTVYDFEWIVVDDESTDDTKLFLEKVRNMGAPFPIQSFEQKHGGKHRAMNLAVKLAKGKYFFPVDSDDWLPENAMELIISWLKEIQDIPSLCGVAGQKALADGKPVGSSFACDEEYIDASSLERKKLHIEGDKAEVFATEVLRKHPFPEFDGEYFVTEAVCWNAIAADGYKLRWYQEPIYCCEYLEDGLTKTGANDLSGHIANFQGYTYYIRQCLAIKKRLDSYQDFVDFEKTCDAMKLSEWERAEALQWSKEKYRANKALVMPIVHNIKRVIYVFQKRVHLFQGKRDDRRRQEKGT